MKKIYSIITVILLLLTTVSASLAWFAAQSVVPSGGEITTGYFARGEGTATDPYVINRPIHLYNLAWLQNFGRFNDTFDENGNLVQYHFVLEGDTIDMSDYVLPPIGTTEYPFIGTFTSIGEEPCVITGLTVSNVVANDDITARPHGVNELNNVEIIGMFGVIGKYNNVPAVGYTNVVPKVSNFFLDEPVIRTHTEKTLIGLIAGYVNGKVHEVGVKGGTLFSGEGNTSGLSNSNISIYSLIGDRSDEVKWGGVNKPGEDAGGALQVDANDSATQTAADAVADGESYKEIPNSDERAFFVGDISTSAFNGKLGSIRFYKNRVTKSDTFVSADSSSNFYTLPNSVSYNEQNIQANVNSSFKINTDLADRLTHGGLKTIKTGTTAPNYTDLQSIVANGKTISVPQNGIWFKPVSFGDCIISFGVPNMKNDRYKSIYSYTRNDNGTINTASWTETRLHFDTKTFSNKDIIIYHFEISEADFKAGREYVIGSSEGYESDEIMFYFLALAGTSNSGGNVTSTSKEIFEVNFIDSADYGYDTIYGPDNKITTFILTLSKTGTDTYVTHRRESMTVHAESEVSSDNSLISTKQEHIGIPPENVP